MYNNIFKITNSISRTSAISTMSIVNLRLRFHRIHLATRVYTHVYAHLHH